MPYVNIAGDRSPQRRDAVINNVGLRYFVGVARAGSIRRAAEQLHVAASAISRQMQLLEEDLGAQLFERHRGQKELKLTPAGEVVLEYARMIDNELEQVRASISSIDKLERGSIRIGVSESFTRHFLPELMQEFHAKFPGIRFEVSTSGGAKLIDELTKDHIDIILGYLVPETFDVQVMAQAFTRPSLLVAKSHPFASRRYVEVSECAGLELAVPDDTLTIRDSYARMFRAARVTPNVVLVTNSFELMREAAAVGLCNAIVNPYFGVTAVPRGLRYIPLRGKGVEQWPISLCVHAGRHLPVAVRHFVDHTKAAMERASRD
ncbi:LysR family transcriptional regulator [Mesorhizobium sp. SB112]|uniref:LysR family transcriptional regulator n=1 Tax=Mesorhizobium sp. SB112 TaxID=3151853 RepID=UPI003263501B